MDLKHLTVKTRFLTPWGLSHQLNEVIFGKVPWILQRCMRMLSHYCNYRDENNQGELWLSTLQSNSLGFCHQWHLRSPLKYRVPSPWSCISIYLQWDLWACILPGGLGSHSICLQKTYAGWRPGFLEVKHMQVRTHHMQSKAESQLAFTRTGQVT